jgi:hypothetical protein
MKVLTSKSIERTKIDIEKNQSKSLKSRRYNIDDLREMSYTLPTNYSFTIYRVYLSTGDSAGLKDVGWVINDKNTFCLSCFKDFGMNRWKHHCRACGNLVCKDCSNYENRLLRLESLGMVKVCHSCYKPVSLTPCCYQSWFIFVIFTISVFLSFSFFLFLCFSFSISLSYAGFAGHDS